MSIERRYSALAMYFRLSRLLRERLLFEPLRCASVAYSPASDGSAPWLLASLNRNADNPETRDRLIEGIPF